MAAKASGKGALDKVRKICLALPDAREQETWGHPTFRVAGRIFASFGVHRDRPRVTVKADRSEQEVLVDDVRFFRAPYVGQHGWVGIWVDRRVPWSMVDELVRASYRRIAPRRLVRQLDEEEG